jgi:hypothetical protein
MKLKTLEKLYSRIQDDASPSQEGEYANFCSFAEDLDQILSTSQKYATNSDNLMHHYHVAKSSRMEQYVTGDRKKVFVERRKKHTEVRDQNNTNEQDQSQTNQQSANDNNLTSQSSSLLRREIYDLTRQLEEEKEKQQCIICFNDECNCVLLPCRHQTLCSSCAEQVTDCPICRTAIEQRINVFR